MNPLSRSALGGNITIKTTSSQSESAAPTPGPGAAPNVRLADTVEMASAPSLFSQLDTLPATGPADRGAAQRIAMLVEALAQRLGELGLAGQEPTLTTVVTQIAAGGPNGAKTAIALSYAIAGARLTSPPDPEALGATLGALADPTTGPDQVNALLTDPALFPLDPALVEALANLPFGTSAQAITGPVDAAVRARLDALGDDIPRELPGMVGELHQLLPWMTDIFGRQAPPPSLPWQLPP